MTKLDSTGRGPMLRHVRFIVICFFLINVSLKGQDAKTTEPQLTDIQGCPYSKSVEKIVNAFALEMK